MSCHKKITKKIVSGTFSQMKNMKFEDKINSFKSGSSIQLNLRIKQRKNTG